MDPKCSRRGWFRGVFAALVGGWASQAAKAGAAAAPGALAAAGTPLVYHTYIGGAGYLPGATYCCGQTTTCVYDAVGTLMPVDPSGAGTTVVYELTQARG
jgi:hypothetical protein